MSKALGLIEVVGFTTALAAIDAAVKTANVLFLGFESVIGVAKKITLTVKLQGDVDAVKEAVEAGIKAASKVGKVFASNVIPRPHDDIKQIVLSKDTLLSIQKKSDNITKNSLKNKYKNNKK